MKVLVIGGGGREHALAWKIAQSPRVTRVFVAPGNAGTCLEPNTTNVDLAADDVPALLAFAQRERAAHAWAHCHRCEAELPDPVGTTGRCSGCRRRRYCGASCQRDDWPRHRAECNAWKAEANAALVAAGGCPVGDVAAQEAAVDKWQAPERTLAEIRAASERGDIAAQHVLSMCFREGARGAPKDEAQFLAWTQRAASSNLAGAQTQQPRGTR